MCSRVELPVTLFRMRRPRHEQATIADTAAVVNSASSPTTSSSCGTGAPNTSLGFGFCGGGVHRDKVQGYVDAGVEAGAELVVDGRDPVVDGEPGGFWLGPTLFDKVTTDMSIYVDEIFGPLLSVPAGRLLRRRARPW